MKTAIITIIGMILLLSVVSANVISIFPEALEDISMYSGESITQNITIKTDGNYLVYLSWDVEGNSSDVEGFYVDFESPIFVEREKTIQITISTDYNFKSDSFTINLYASTERAEEEIVETFIQNQTTEIETEEFNLTLEIDSNGTGNIVVTTFKENPESGFGIPSLNIFFYINTSSSIIDGMNETIIKVSYTDEEVNALGIEESTLRLYYFNETSDNWEGIESWVDTSNNVVYGITTHFSLWGIFGSLIPEEEPESKKSSGGGICYRGYTTTEWTDCIDNKQTREVKKDWKICYNTKQDKPIESQSCEIPDDVIDIILDDEDEIDYRIMAVGSLIALIILILALINKKRRESETKRKIVSRKEISRD